MGTHCVSNAQKGYRIEAHGDTSLPLSPSLNGFGKGRILAHIRLDNATREGAAAVPGKGRGSFEIKPITPPLLPLPLRRWGERGEEKPSANCSMFFPLPSPWSQTADVAIVRKRNELPASPLFSPRPFLQTMQAIYLGQFAQHLWQRGEGRGKLLRHSTTQRRNLDGAFSTPSSAMSLFHPSTLSRSENKQKSNFFPLPSSSSSFSLVGRFIFQAGLTRR